MNYIDLHLHLDGAITTEIAKKLAKMQHMVLPESDLEIRKMLSVSETCKDLNDFLQCFSLPLSLLQTEEAIEEAVYLVQENIKKEGVIYSEIRFAPQLHCKKELNQEQVLLAALKGLKRSDLFCNLILCCMRGENTRELNMETVRLCKKYLMEDDGIVALDLAGAEGIFPTEDYREEFILAKKLGIPFTIHAGEAAGPDSVKKALDFGAVRIGHGVRSAGDSKLLSCLKEKEICLEMCPTSNRQTRAVENMEDYPLKQYLEMGICVTVNTDDMAILQTSMPQEFSYIRNMYGITFRQEQILLKNAVRSAFTTSQKKQMLLQQILNQGIKNES